MPTTVVKVTKANRHALLADPDFVWVGRSCPRLGMKQSIFGNPWVVGQEWEGQMITREGAVRRFKEAIRVGSPSIYWGVMRAGLHTLAGKKLGCVCGDWKPGDEPLECHAVHLAELVDGVT